MKLKGLWVKNYVRFKYAYLPLDRIGITKIVGKNLDSDTKLVPVGDDTNAVGKTALVSGISQLVFASSPVTQDIKSKAKKDAFKRKNSAIGLEVEYNNKDYTLEKKTKRNGIEYLIHKGNEDTHVRTKKYPEEKIRKMFDMTEDEFYTLWSISSSRPSKLQYGTAAVRFQFFTNFFKLNNHDEIRKIFNGLLRNAKESKAALNEILQQIDNIKSTPEEELVTLKDKLSSYQKKAKNLADKYSELHSKEMDLAFFNDSKQIMKKWESITKGLEVNTEHDIKKLLDKAVYYVKEAKEYENFIVKMETYKNAKRKYVKDKEIFSKIMDSYEGSPPENYRNKIKELEEKKLLLSSILKKKIDFELVSFKKIRIEIKGLNEERLNKDKAELVNKIAVNKEAYRAINRLKGHSNCPTCTARIDSSLSKSLLKKYKKKVDAYKKDLEDVTSKITIINKHKQMSLDYIEYKKYKKAKKEYKAVQSKLESLSNWDPYFEAKEKLESLEKPSKPKIPAKISLSRKDLEKYKEIKTTAPLVLPIYTRYKNIDVNGLEDIPEKIKELKEKLNVINLKIPRLTSEYDLAKKANEDFLKLKERRKKLSKEASDIEILELLVEAYSNKGIKLMIIRYIASVVEKNMNQYASLIYPEKIKFKFQVLNDREFNILREVKTSKGIEVDDIRVLSGAESRAFSYLLPLATMPLIPKERRLNVMILDEPTVNMGSARLELFVKNFIPKLNQVVPHLIIVSTSDEQYSNCKTYQIIKKKGKSKLEAA